MEKETHSSCPQRSETARCVRLEADAVWAFAGEGKRLGMHWLHGGGVLGWGCLLLAACAPQPATVSPAETVARLRTGEPLLRCREPCVAAWRQAQPQAAQLAASGRWADLAALTISVDYQDDLSLYYLGQAAERLG